MIHRQFFPGGKFAPADRSPLLYTPHGILGGRPFPDTVSRKPVPTAESKPTGRNCSLWWGKPTGRILLSFRLSRIYTGRIPATSGNLSLSLPKGQRHENCNDPAAGSPTATLLRLLLPLAAGHCPISAGNARPEGVVRPPDDSIQPPSVATTGGVYKWQGHNRSGLMTQAY